VLDTHEVRGSSPLPPNPSKAGDGRDSSKFTEQRLDSVPAFDGMIALSGSLYDLIDAIRRACNVTNFDLYAPVAFTDRQVRLLEALRHSDTKAKARSILSESLEPLPLGTGGRFPAEV
jgi:hypothetical protein